MTDQNPAEYLTCEQITTDFFGGILALFFTDPQTPEEFTRFKTVYCGPAGQRYLIQVLHVDGPKLKKEDLSIEDPNDKPTTTTPQL